MRPDKSVHEPYDELTLAAVNLCSVLLPCAKSAVYILLYIQCRYGCVCVCLLLCARCDWRA